MLLLQVLCFFDLFVDSIHNVAPQEEVANLWHIKESKTIIGIWSSIRFATLKIGMNFNMGEYALTYL
jgi:hypothetical protein